MSGLAASSSLSSLFDQSRGGRSAGRVPISPPSGSTTPGKKRSAVCGPGFQKHKPCCVWEGGVSRCVDEVPGDSLNDFGVDVSFDCNSKRTPGR